MIKVREASDSETFIGRLCSAYIETIYFTDTGDIDQPAADTPLSKEARAKIERDVQSFWGRVIDCNFPADTTYDQIMHDFWFTRNGHGVGFWDRPEIYGEQLAEQLTEIAESFGEQWTYESDNNELEIS